MSEKEKCKNKHSVTEMEDYINIDNVLVIKKETLNEKGETLPIFYCFTCNEAEYYIKEFDKGNRNIFFKINLDTIFLNEQDIINLRDLYNDNNCQNQEDNN